MEELKMLKEQLASAEAAKTFVQKKLENVQKTVVFPQSRTLPNVEDVEEEDENDKPLPFEKDCDSCITSNVDEIAACLRAENAKIIEETSRSKEKEEMEAEIAMVRAKLVEKDKELEIIAAEKESLKKEAEKANASSSTASKRTEEMEIKLAVTNEELKQTKSLVEQLKQELGAEKIAKASTEAEMKRLRIQTDQWRKASEAAASILATGDENFRSSQKTLESYNGVLWSPLITGAEVDEGAEGQKKRGSVGGIRLFGELWKKKGQQN